VWCRPRQTTPPHPYACDNYNDNEWCAFCFQTNLMILYLEAVNYKVVTALATLEGHPPAAASNALSQHIETTRDKNGYQMSVLKVRTYTSVKLYSDNGLRDQIFIIVSISINDLFVRFIVQMPASVCQKLTSTAPIDVLNESMWSDRGSADGTDIGVELLCDVYNANLADESSNARCHIC